MTHATVDYAALQDGLRTFLNGTFGGLEILSVSIEEDAKSGTDRVLEINVVFKGTPDDLVRARPAGLTGMLREKLADMREAAFPVLSFIPAESLGSP